MDLVDKIRSLADEYSLIMPESDSRIYGNFISSDIAKTDLILEPDWYEELETKLPEGVTVVGWLYVGLDGRNGWNGRGCLSSVYRPVFTCYPKYEEGV